MKTKKKFVLTATVVCVSFTTIFTSCSSPEKQVAERSCACVEPLMNFMQDSSILALDKWYNSLDLGIKASISMTGTAPAGFDVDKEKTKKFLENKKKSEEMVKEQESCINAIKDEFGEEKIKDKNFAKQMRIHLREICPESAKKMGI